MAKKSKAIKDLERLLKKITSARSLRSIGQMSIKIVKDRTREKGQGVDKPGGRLKTLKAVTPEYAKQREKTRRHPKAAKGRRSNLTRTGALINKLKIVKIDKNKHLLFIGWKDLENQMKAVGQEAQGRPFLYLSASEAVKVRNDFNKLVDELARKV